MSDQFTIKAQLNVDTNKPPIVGMQVLNFAELIVTGAKNSYLHKVVWVISEKGYYYLSSGNGTNLNQWLPVDIGSILEYQNKPYPLGSAVIVNGKVFVSISPVATGEDPINHPLKWLALSTIRFEKQSFANVDEITVITPYQNPTVQVFDNDGNEISAFININTGVVKVDLFPPTSGFIIVKE